MGNKATIPLTNERYIEIIKTMRNGFEFNGVKYKPNPRIAMILQVQTNLGLRIGDVLQLRLENIYWTGEKYKLDIVEQKTNKRRHFTVPTEFYNFMKLYCLERGIKETARMFQITERAVQMHLKHVCDYLGYDRVSTHSFRKKYGTDIYNKSGHNIELVKRLYQHSNIAITQRYLGVEERQVEEAIENTVNIIY